MKSLGDRLSDIAGTLQKPNTHVFYVDEGDTISAGKRGAAVRRPVAQVTPAEINFKRLLSMPRGYNKATEDKRQSIARLRLMGIQVSE